MTIREKRTPISQFAAALRQRSPQEKRDLLVADTLDSLCRHCDLYDAARVSSNPFHPELLRTIAAADLSSEARTGTGGHQPLSSATKVPPFLYAEPTLPGGFLLQYAAGCFKTA